MRIIFENSIQLTEVHLIMSKIINRDKRILAKISQTPKQQSTHFDELYFNRQS